MRSHVFRSSQAQGQSNARAEKVSPQPLEGSKRRRVPVDLTPRPRGHADRSTQSLHANPTRPMNTPALLRTTALSLLVATAPVVAAPHETIPSENASAPATPEPLKTEFLYEALVTIDAPVTVGPTPHGGRRYIPITGGTFAGPTVKGVILPGGADWQTDRPDGVTEADALYSVRCDDGTVIIVHNQGVIAKGGAYMRTALRFEAPEGPHSWLNQSQFVSSISGGPRPGSVIIRVFRVL